MSIFEIIYFSIYFSIALAIGIGLAVALGFSLHAELRWGRWIMPGLVLMLAAAITAGTILSHRNLEFAAKNIGLLTATGGGGGGWVLRFMTVAILLLCAARIFGSVLRKRTLEPAPGTGLLFAFLVFFVSNNLLSSAFGTEPMFVHNMLYPVLVFVAAWVARREPLETSINAAKWAVYMMMFLSLLLAAKFPKLALEPHYHGFLPGVTSRLWGVGSNPNSIGPLAVLSLLLEYMQPTRAPFLRWNLWRWWKGLPFKPLSPMRIVLLRGSIIFAATIVLLWAQSKTAWLVGMAATVVVVWYRWGRTSRGGLDIRFATLGMLMASLVVLILSVVDVGSLLDRLSDSVGGQDFSTFSGRSQIWDVAINEWLRNPLFGYGPDIWGEAFRQKIGMAFAFSAHNQFLQSLSSAGLFGLISLLAYLAVLVPNAFRMAAATRGVSVALMLMILMRCITENPLDVGSLYSGDFLTHVVLFMIVLRAGQTERAGDKTPVIGSVSMQGA